jgi:hypothetical protein
MERKYESKYGAEGLITAAQFLAEEICQRIAKKENKVLGYRFWQKPEWKKIFQRQIVAANALLKEKDCLQIMSFLRSSKGKWILSLGLKKPILEGCKPTGSGPFGQCGVEPSGTIENEFILEEIDNEKEINKRSLWSSLNE